MGMPGRKWNSGNSYQYGFGGKRKDSEIYGEGNAYDFEARIFDPRLARWLTVDPLFTAYPHQSSYVAMSNDPLNRIDPTGMGDYYDKDGKHLGSDGKMKTITVGKGKNAKTKQVSDDKAYVCESVTIGKNGLVSAATNSVELSMSNSELGKFARMIYKEAWGDDLKESYGIANATVNYVNYMKEQGIDYSIIEAASKISSAWDGKTLYSNARFSIGAAINAITGGHDYSEGAIKWDGGDLASRGFSQYKPAHEGIEISESLFNAFKTAWPDKDLQLFWGNKTATFSNNFTSGIHVATASGTFKGICVYQATAVHGHTIFWGVNKDPIIRKTIWVSPFKTPGYSNPSIGLEDFPSPTTLEEHPNSIMSKIDWRNIFKVN